MTAILRITKGNKGTVRHLENCMLEEYPDGYMISADHMQPKVIKAEEIQKKSNIEHNGAEEDIFLLKDGTTLALIWG